MRSVGEISYFDGLKKGYNNCSIKNIESEESRFLNIKNFFYGKIIDNNKKYIKNCEVRNNYVVYMNSFDDLYVDNFGIITIGYLDRIYGIKKEFYNSIKNLKEIIKTEEKINKNMLEDCIFQDKELIKRGLILSPTVVNRMLLVPINQILNSNNSSDIGCIKTYKFPKCLSIIDMPLSSDNLLNKHIDCTGKRTKNRIFIKNGKVNNIYGVKKDPSNMIVDGYTRIHNGELKLSMHKPIIKSGTEDLYSYLHENLIIEIINFIGNININSDIIQGKFTNSVIWKNGKCVGIIKEIPINFSFSALLNSIEYCFKQHYYANNILFSDCPYILIRKGDLQFNE